MRYFYCLNVALACAISANAHSSTTFGNATDVSNHKVYCWREHTPANNVARQPDLNTTRCSDFCAGTNPTGDINTYICGDPRLGPVRVPDALPLDGIVGGESSYRRFGGVCPGEFLAQWTNATTGEFVYPPFDGYVLTTSGERGVLNISLAVGTLLDRFGSEFGSYTSAAGSPYAQRSLPPWNLNAPAGSRYPYNYQVYVVTRPLQVQSGPIAGWFGQQGLGLQFLMPQSLRELVQEGYLTRLNQTADPLW